MRFGFGKQTGTFYDFFFSDLTISCLKSFLTGNRNAGDSHPTAAIVPSSVRRIAPLWLLIH